MIGTVVLGVAALLGTSIVRFSTMCARRIGAGVMMFGVQAHWRRRITRRYLALPVSWHQKHPTGTLLSNANADVEAATRPLAPLPFACGTLFMVVIAMAAFFWIDWAVALVALAMFPTLFALNALFATKMAPRAKRAQELRAEVSAVGHESFDGALVVKAMGREAAETERFSASAEELRDAMIGVGRLRAAFEPAIAGLPEIGVLIALLVGLARFEAGAIDLGQLVTVSFMFSVLAFPVRAIGWVLGDLPGSVVGRRRVDHVLTATGDMDYGDKDLPATTAPAALAFDAVAYAYPDGHEALHEVTFTVEPGTTVALVGATGSGVVGEAVGLEGQVGELRDVGLQRDAVLQADGHRDREGVHHAGEGGALLAELEEDLAELAVVVGAGGEVPLGTAHGERRGQGLAGLRQALAGRLVDDDFLDAWGLDTARCARGLDHRTARAWSFFDDSDLPSARGWPTLQLSR